MTTPSEDVYYLVLPKLGLFSTKILQIIYILLRYTERKKFNLLLIWIFLLEMVICLLCSVKLLIKIVLSTKTTSIIRIYLEMRVWLRKRELTTLLPVLINRSTKLRHVISLSRLRVWRTMGLISVSGLNRTSSIFLCYQGTKQLWNSCQPKKDISNLVSQGL